MKTKELKKIKSDIDAMEKKAISLLNAAAGPARRDLVSKILENYNRIQKCKERLAKQEKQ